MDILRRLKPSDFLQVVAVYRDAVMSQAQGLYSQVQIEAWAENAGRDDGLRNALQRGYGLASCAGRDSSTIEAFALLDPIDRLSLLYCRGRASRQGRATALLHAIEDRARQHGCACLRTEASQLSRPLLEREGWRVDAEEEVIFAGVRFLRWRMIKELILSPNCLT
jgi:putative acetyltransferase